MEIFRNNWFNKINIYNYKINILKFVKNFETKTNQIREKKIILFIIS